MFYNVTAEWGCRTMEARRVVITGMGTINPLGNNVSDFWKAIQNEECGIDKITLFDTSAHEAKIAAEVKNFDPSLWNEKKDARKMARFTQFAVAASVEAFQNSGLKEAPEECFYAKDQIGVYMGNGIGGIEIFEESHRKLITDGSKRMLPMTVPLMIINEAAGNVAMRLGLNGPALTVGTACASGTDAIGQAYEAIKSGQIECALAGGTEAAVSPFGLGGFSMLKAISSHYNETPKKASRPFDKDRDGFVMGEGAGMLVLESYENAIKRGAVILAELAGYGASCDAYHLTSPDPEGATGAKAIKIALDKAKLSPSDIDYYNAHGTSTPINDPTETKMLKKAFGDHAYKMKVSSTKGMTGHLIAAAGAVEAIICVLAMKDSFYPATLNLDNPDEQCDLDYVPNKGVKGSIKASASGSLGFGGHNAVLVFKKV